MTAEDLAVRVADRLPLREIKIAVRDVPGEPSNVVRPRAGGGERRDDVAESLADLTAEVVGLES